MSTTPDNLIAAQRAVLETSQTIGAKSVEAAAKLFQLQCEAARGLYGHPPPVDIASNMINTMSSAARANDYLQRVSSLWLSSGEMVRLLQTQAERTQSWINELVKANLQNAPAFAASMPTLPLPALPTTWTVFPQIFGQRLF